MKYNYKNQYIKLGLLSIVLALFGQLSLVQVKAAVDTLGADEALDKKHVTQVPLEQCNRIDTCSVTRFAIVSKDGKLGIYDLEKHENVTEIVKKPKNTIRSVKPKPISLTNSRNTKRHGNIGSKNTTRRKYEV